jgi:hypothetical protein
VIVKNNFLSFVTLGSFNPAILTPDFLKDQEIWTTDKPPQGQSSPVVSNIRFGDISFFVELERFQVIHHDVKEFHKSPIVEAGYKYLDVLKHTPLLIQGINFNVNLLEYKDSSGIKTIFEDPIAGMINYTEKSEEYLIDVGTAVTQGKRETRTINCKYYTEAEISVSINLRKQEIGILLNFNQEVENLRRDRNKARFIYDNYQGILGRFLQFVEAIKE